MGKCEKNQELILSMLRQNGRLSVVEIVSALNVSQATVRRYFTEMEQNGLVMRVFGGICLPSSGAMNEYRFSTKAASHMEEKQKIGKTAAALIQPHDQLFFDSGTTVRECSRALVELARHNKKYEISIITNSLVYDETLPQVCKLDLIGGLVRPNRMDLTGMATLNNLERFNFAKAFLGADGISEDGELTTTDEETSLLAAAVIKHSAQVFILADSSKFGLKSFVQYGQLQGKKYTLVTDSAADKAILDKFRAKGITVIIAN